MKKTVAIIAPMLDEKLVNIDFNLTLKRDNRQMTLATLHDLARNGYKPDRLRGYSYEEETISAAGYWLTGLL
ncbi:MAG: hypothetical protein ACE5I1_22800 [bacterium]